MTDADTIAAFLRQIIAHPADDGPRIVYADWCEEHGQGERAELIRAQVEIAKITSELQSDEDCEAGFCVSCDDRRKLRRRAHELLTQHEPDWAGEFMPDARWTYAVSDRSFTFRDGGQAIFHWHRGFIRQVECTLETWRGRTCERCGGDGKAHGSDRPFEWTPYAKAYLCPTCHGVGRTGGIGPQLVRHAPIEAVVVTDRTPYWNGHGYCWYNVDRPMPNESVSDSAALRSDLFERIPGNFSRRWKSFPSADAANAALSSVLLQEARETPLTEQKEKVYS